MKKKNYVFLLLMLLPSIACERSDLMPEFERKSNESVKSVQTEKYEGDYVSLNFTAKENSLRSMLPIEDRSSAGKTSIKIKWEKGTQYDMKCVLYNKNNPEQTSYADIKCTVTDVRRDGTATIKYKGEIQLKSGKLQGGEWYMQLFMGLGDKYWNPGSNSYQIGQRLVARGGDMTLDIPIACPWTKLSVSGNSVSATVSLKPLGSIFALEIESPLCDEMTLRRIDLNTQLFRGLGEFKLGEVTEPSRIEGSFPEFKPMTSFSRTSSRSSFDLNYTMGSNYNTQKPQVSEKLYFWAMPNTSVVSGDILGNIFVADPEDQSEYGGIPIRSNIYRGTGLKEGSTHTIRMRIEESDLLISEFYHYNPQGYNYSMIELYNPTCRDIDLSNYSLVRQRAIMDPDAGWISEGRFQPTDNVKYITDAIRQDIFIPNESEPVRVVDGREARTVHAWGSAKNLYFEIHGDYNKMLPPGKTVILCAGGTYNAYKWTKKVSDYPEAYVGNYIKKAKEHGDIHYMIAVDNGQKAHDYQHSVEGGVMQHGQNHVMILMKGQDPIDVTGPFAYLMAEGRKPDDYNKLSSKTQVDNYKVFTKQVPVLSARHDWFSLVRRSWSHYPSRYWDNNKESSTDNKQWDVQSRWILIAGRGAGGTKISSWGTRNPKSSYFDYGFITRTIGSTSFYPNNMTPN